MKTTRSIVLCTMIIVQTIKAQNNNHKIYLEGMLSGGVQQSDAVAGVGGALGVFLNKNSSIDIRVREVYNFNNMEISGPINIHYRYNFDFGLFVGGGFAHHHEVQNHTYMHHPVESVMGMERNIFHRSGLGFEVGYNFKPFAKKGFFSVFYPSANVVINKMFMDSRTNPLVTANVGIRVGLKKFN